MIENIPQVTYMDITSWPKDMHLGYVKNVIRRIDEEFDVDNPAPAKLQGEITPLKAAVSKEDQDYEQSRKSDQTALIQQADDERDALLNQALTVIDAMAKVSAIPASQQAALALQRAVEVYKPSAKLDLRTESTQVEQWLQAISQSVELTQAAATLGITQILSDLGQKNELVITLMDQRAAERAGQSTIQLSEDRKETDRRLRNFIRMLDALATVDDDEARFYAIISKMNEDQGGVEAALRGLPPLGQACVGEVDGGGQPSVLDLPRLDVGAAYRGRQGALGHRRRAGRPHRLDGQEGLEGGRAVPCAERREGEAGRLR